MLRKVLTVLSLTLMFMLATGVGTAQTARPTPRRTTIRRPAAPPPPIPRPVTAVVHIDPVGLTPVQQLRYTAFKEVWTTIKENYFDQTFSGLNWDAIRNEFQPRILKATTSYEFHSILQEMINRLNRSHFVIIPPEVFDEMEKAKDKVKQNETGAKNDPDEDAPDDEDEGDEDGEPPFGEDDELGYGIGIDIRVIGGQVVITNVENGSTAETAGLKPGFVIEKVNGVSLKTLFGTFATSGGYGKLAEKMFPVEILSFFINGDSETAVTVGYLDEKDVAREVSVKREKLKGVMVKASPNFPKEFFSFQSRSLNADTGYIKFNVFALAAIDGVCRALDEFKDKKAVIVDMRGNLGGSMGVLMGITGMMIDKPVNLGTQIFKNSRESVYVRPQGRMYSGKLIVLVDSMSHSAAEIFAGGLQESGRLIVVGEKSAGQALPSTSIRLSTGAIFMYPFANFKTPKGVTIEGVGVEPDVKIPRERKTLLTGRDMQLEAALTLAAAVPVKLTAKEKLQTGKIDMPSSAVMKSRGSALTRVAAAAKPKPELKHDSEALKLIDQFVAAIGGADALKKLDSYSAKGIIEISRAGTTVQGNVEIFNRTPDRIAEIISVEAVGNITSLFDGKKISLLSDIMGNSETTDPAQVGEMSLLSDLQEMTKPKELYRQLIYLGEYERRGKPALMIKAVTADNVEVAMVFDAKTKLLVHRISPYVNIAYDDYRKVGDLMMPFWQTRSDSLVLKLSEFKLNVPLEDSIFVAKDNCFTVREKIEKEEKP